jgi:TorA maturation chaperone TorD
MSDTQVKPVVFIHKPGDEEQQRADLYSVLATLFARAPDQSTLAALAAQIDLAGASVGGGTTPLEQNWRELCAAAKTVSDEIVRAEYEECFLAVGKPAVFLYISFYASGFLHEKPLAQIRQHLNELGISRKEGVSETEDHIASLCEVMRFLITVDDPALGSMETQRDFFQRHLASWFEPLADAIAACPTAHFYPHVAQVLRSFLSVERLAFDYEE